MSEILQSPQALEVFNFDDCRIRTLVVNGEPWFVASDVSEALAYSEARDLVRILEDYEKGRQIVPTPGGPQEMLVINESGVYSAVLKSRKAEARRFKRWVTETLLPAVRRGLVGSKINQEDRIDRMLSVLESQSVVAKAQSEAVTSSLSVMTRILEDMSRRSSLEPIIPAPASDPTIQKALPIERAPSRLTALAVGKKVGLLNNDINDLLSDYGLQKYQGGRYTPTAKAKPYLAESVGNQIRWNEEIFKFLTPAKVKKYL